MRVKMVAGMLLGSVVVAVACSAQHALDNPSDKDGGVLDALLDSISSETKDVKAEPGWTSTTVPCDKTAKGAGGVTWYYAELSLPGRSKADLSRVATMVCGDTPVDGLPADYKCTPSLPAFRDGAVAVRCGTTFSASAAVTFTLPPPI